ncbi:MAG TPA: hypothetical protein VMT56_00415 [Candidatus Bathyarchaeia archaeon]|nr:hypothetical protein [Candidatus Bathyarchaeia archaeon]
MKLKTIRSEIRSVAERWDRQYAAKGDSTPAQRAIGVKLHALDKETASRETLQSIIGNGSWVDVHCAECDRDVGMVVTLENTKYGDPGDWDYEAMDICPDCLRAALKLASPVRGKR